MMATVDSVLLSLVPGTTHKSMLGYITSLHNQGHCCRCRNRSHWTAWHSHMILLVAAKLVTGIGYFCLWVHLVLMSVVIGRYFSPSPDKSDNFCLETESITRSGTQTFPVCLTLLRFEILAGLKKNGSRILGV